MLLPEKPVKKIIVAGGDIFRVPFLPGGTSYFLTFGHRSYPLKMETHNMQSSIALRPILEKPNVHAPLSDKINCKTLQPNRSLNAQNESTTPSDGRTLPLAHLGACGERQAKLEFGAFADDAFYSRAEKVRTQMEAPQNLAILPFSQAAEIWLELHRDSIKERTYNDYRFYIRTLNKAFKDLPLSAIHIGLIVEYRRERQKTAGAECINHEITTLRQIMEMAGLWDLIRKHYKPLKVRQSGPPRVLTPEEEEKFFRVVAQAVWSGAKPEWEAAYLATSVSNNTTAVGCELRFLQLKHIFLDHVPPKIHIPDDKAKNEFRARVIPLNSVALKQVQRLMERAKRLGSVRPDHYLFPFRIKKGEYDANRPASAFFIRSAFRSMKKALGPEFKWLQPRHWRNQCFTKLFEAGVSDETIISIGGHAAIKMSRYYSRIRIHAKAEALDRIAPKSETVKKRDKGASA